MIRIRTILLPLLLAVCTLTTPNARQVAHAHADRDIAADRVALDLLWESPSAKPGDTVLLAVIMNVETGWHIYPGIGSPDEVSGYIATEINITAPANWNVGRIKWPRAHDFLFAGEELKSLEGEAVAFVPITIDINATPGQHAIDVDVRYQACDVSICEMPANTQARSTLRIESIDAPQPNNDDDGGDGDDGRRELRARIFPTDSPSNTTAGKTNPQIDSTESGRATITLALERPRLVPNDQVGLAVIMNMESTWHITPGLGSGHEYNLPTEISLELPPGWSASDVQWPEPHLVTITGPNGPEDLPAYEGKQVAYIGLRLPADIEAGEYEINASLDYQACDPEICEPPATALASIIAHVVTGDTGTTSDIPTSDTIRTFAGFDAHAAFADNSNSTRDNNTVSDSSIADALRTGIPWAKFQWFGVGVIIWIGMLFMAARTFLISKRMIAPIITLICALIIGLVTTSFVISATSHAEGWENFTHDGFNAARERGDIVIVDFTADWCLNCKTVEQAVLKTGAMQAVVSRPNVTAFIADITTGKEEAMQFKETVPNLAGGIPILAIYFPDSTLENPLRFQGLYTLGPVLDAIETGGQPAAQSGHEFDFFGWRFSVNAAWIILIIAAFAGFFLNVTPCVLPVVPIKILSLQHHAKNPARCFFLGLVFAAGIVAVFAILGILMGVLALFQWGEIFQEWWANLALGLIILFMALGMFGLFVTQLPDWIYLFNPQSERVSGTFSLGMLTAVLATPCAGPLLGAAITWSQTQTAFIALMMFIVMGVGMAFPYVILTANPKWIDRIPKSGPGSELVKQVMGILLIAAAWFFLANVPLTMQSSSPSSQTAATTPMTTTTTTTREPETSPTERS